MGVSTDGQICFGVAFPESFEFPWDEEKYGGDIEAWWLTACGWRPPFKIYDEKGEYIDGVKPPEDKLKEYFERRDKYVKSHPVPVELVNYCSDENAIYILAVPSSCLSCNRGCPLEIHPDQLTVSDDEVNALQAFIKKRVPITKDALEYVEEGFDKSFTPKWYLSSYWG